MQPPTRKITYEPDDQGWQYCVALFDKNDKLVKGWRVYDELSSILVIVTAMNRMMTKNGYSEYCVTAYDLSKAERVTPVKILH